MNIQNYEHTKFHHMKYSDVKVVRRFRLPKPKNLDLVFAIQLIILAIIFYDFGIVGLLTIGFGLVALFWHQIYCFKFEFSDGDWIFIKDTMVMRLIREYLKRRDSTHN